MTRYPTVPSILDNILRDATEYFMLIFSAQILSLLFLFVTPVRDMVFSTIAGRVLLISSACVQENVQLIPAM